MFCETDTEIESGHAARQAFGGVAEIWTVFGRYIVAPTVDLSLNGCFVRTRARLPLGANVKVRITHEGRACVVLGRVVNAVLQEGMDIAFDGPPPKYYEVFEAWLK